MPFYAAGNLCPNCARPISRDDTDCEACGCELEPRLPGNSSPLPDGVARHRGWRIVILAVMSLLTFPVACCALSLSDYMLRIGFMKALPYLLFGGSVFAVGHFCGGASVVFAIRDWIGMRTGRVDATGKGRTVVGGVMALVSVLLYWVMIGGILVSLL